MRGTRKRKKRGISLKNLLIILFSIVIVIIALLLPYYYKTIWPSVIGEPAKASTVDILAFWGAVFGGIITLVGVFFTIQFSRREIEETMHQQEKDQFIKGFGATVLEINSISFEIKKFRNYLNQLKVNLEEYVDTGIFKEIMVEFDSKEDYKKIRKQHKPDLEIICNRFEGKAAHADGFVYYHISILSKDIKTFQRELFNTVDQYQLHESSETSQHERYNAIFDDIEFSLLKCERNLKDYKEKLGKTFIDYAEEDGLLESSSKGAKERFYEFLKRMV
jgi:hypothetical protein